MGEDGYPKRIFDKLTGKIDQACSITGGRITTFPPS